MTTSPDIEALGSSELAQVLTGYRNMGPEGDALGAVQHLCEIATTLQAQIAELRRERDGTRAALKEACDIAAEDHLKREAAERERDALKGENGRLQAQLDGLLPTGNDRADAAWDAGYEKGCEDERNRRETPRLEALERRPSREAVARIVEEAIEATLNCAASDCSTSRHFALEAADRLLALFALPGEEK